MPTVYALLWCHASSTSTIAAALAYCSRRWCDAYRLRSTSHTRQAAFATCSPCVHRVFTVCSPSVHRLSTAWAPHMFTIPFFLLDHHIPGPLSGEFRHTSLGLSFYAHCSSPIRRFSDLCNQHALFGTVDTSAFLAQHLPSAGGEVTPCSQRRRQKPQRHHGHHGHHGHHEPAPRRTSPRSPPPQSQSQSPQPRADFDPNSDLASNPDARAEVAMLSPFWYAHHRHGPPLSVTPQPPPRASCVRCALPRYDPNLTGPQGSAGELARERAPVPPW